MKTSGYVVDAYHLLDFISKNKVTDVFEVEMYIRNHMYMGSYVVNEEQFPERSKTHTHLQTEASKVIPKKEDCNGNKNISSEV